MFNRSFHNLFMESMILSATLLASTSAYAEDRNLVVGNGTQTNISTALTKRSLRPNQTPPFKDNSSETTIAQTPKIPAINSDASFQQTNTMSQVTSVSQFSDVQPTDWAFGALQSLVERYGCIAGYPNSTYRGNRAITRYEFAAGLNACLSRINELIATATSDLVTKEDLTTLQRLQAEFSPELATLRGRVDNLEARTAELEANQFSTTTKLVGEAVFAVTNAFSGSVNGSNTVFQDRVRLKFISSFTGKDTLYVRLTGGNATTLKLPNGTGEGLQTFNLSPANNNDFLDWLAYYFPIGDKIDAYVGAVNGVFFDYIPTLSPYLDSATGAGRALTEFASSSPIYRIGGGAGAGINYKFSDKVVLSLGYLAGDHASPEAGSGLFNGQYGAIAQLAWNPNKNSGIGLTYVNAYQNRGAIFDMGSGGAIVGTAQANTPFDQVITNSYGAEAFYKFSPKVAINGFFGYTNAKNLAGSGSADIWYYALGLAFPDLGKEGNLGGILVGAEPYRGGNPAPANDLSLHIEGFYKYRLTDNIAITPGVIWITAPGQNDDNQDAVIGTVRTTFTF
ncbi:MAG: iron uptake porin [Nostoc sp. NMS7]|uniref:iron uptake porin n=1 Tax=Nostoc sp. NMS7 TaxID=2815391 RepID=UPI0025D40963|nr:iron uptake porin [Nostoc sp. NMS7]MBN3946625.1 iron uptake porin [Nostoc sp. NMS7]